LLKGDQIRLDRAKTASWSNNIVPAADLVSAAKTWLKTSPKSKQPWDVDGFKLPGGPVWSKMGMMTFPAANALYRKETQDNYPAARAIMSCVYEGLQVPFDTALAYRVALRSRKTCARRGGRDDPLAVRLDAGTQQGRAPPGEHCADDTEEDRRARMPALWARASLRLRRRPGSTWADRPRPGRRDKGKAYSGT